MVILLVGAGRRHDSLNAMIRRASLRRWSHWCVSGRLRKIGPDPPHP
jgi:hypothetical protein